MKRLFLLCIINLVCSLSIMAQSGSNKVVKSFKITQSSVVKDSAGMLYPFPVWQKLIRSGQYAIRPIDPANDSTAFLIYKATKREMVANETARNNAIAAMPKPGESVFFKLGEKIESFTARDINGEKIKLKELAGKVVVLNFWFIGCPPCRQEIPELNNIALKYRNDPNVVFIAIALDDKYDIKQFIKDNPFAYHIIDDGRMYANLYKINLYPTNVILDREGKVRFHASGYGPNTPYWITKTIEELK